MEWWVGKVGSPGGGGAAQQCGCLCVQKSWPICTHHAFCSGVNKGDQEVDNCGMPPLCCPVQGERTVLLAGRHGLGLYYKGCIL